LVAAVRTLQEDYGLTANGLVGPATVAAVNDAALDRARTLAINLERRRWLKRDPERTRIDVNIAAAQLAYWRDGAVADQRRAVVGEPGNETPELGSPMFRLVANPTWTVPRSIQEEEIADEGPGYLARNNMEWRDGWIVQKSGPRNSLGLVKFDMRNDQAIYLHDTPAKALFSEDLRHASHGCVRVQDALGFAALIAADQGVTEEWDRARATGEETFVSLPRAIPVRLLYQTAFLEGGRMSLKLTNVLWVDEAVTARARIRERTPEGTRVRVHCDVWVDKDDGTRILLGDASALEGA
jgi:murein L,D-transpeptidase YcbB/YkuD